ncbi:hypothetical protein [Streptomyces sp. NBC_01264]|uniref:hypothetical protein n=1 Tax=Streptomyces sp. NBC_01264 TaxID=2903804 RepID=UPI0022519E4B|nr:hypothetical protein [Streptomyces sp. NBC_01264]MCX4778124.1 hypothetical protein [Streptomyces sp. NBC_01264]
MPWVRLDDRFPSHRKVALLSDRAFRLHVTALCWSSENLTEGLIRDKELPVVARIRGLKTVAKELEDAKLWDRTEDGWVIHDYLVYQFSREQVLAEREGNAARQKAWRERKKAEKEAKAAAEKAAADADHNGVTQQGETHDGDTNEARQRHDSDTNSLRSGAENHRSSQVSEIRNGVSNGAPYPYPSRPSVPSPTEKEQKREGQTDQPARIGDRPRIPTNCEPLVAALQQAQLYVGWDLDSTEWFLIEALIKRCGIAALVVSARGSWQGARTQPRKGNYFIPAWRKLASTEQEADYTALPAAVGAEVVQYGPRAHQAAPKPSTTDQRVQQALEVGRRLQALHDAKTQENQ